MLLLTLFLGRRLNTAKNLAEAASVAKGEFLANMNDEILGHQRCHRMAAASRGTATPVWRGMARGV